MDGSVLRNSIQGEMHVESMDGGIDVLSAGHKGETPYSAQFITSLVWGWVSHGSIHRGVVVGSSHAALQEC